MPFCPICRFEYQEGVKTCPDCGAELVDRLEPEKILEKLKPAYITSSPATSQMICELLKDQGIACLTSNQLGSALLPVFGESAEIQILVPENKAEEAQQIIKAYFEENPEEVSLVICSNCGAYVDADLDKCPVCGEMLEDE